MQRKRPGARLLSAGVSSVDSQLIYLPRNLHRGSSTASVKFVQLLVQVVSPATQDAEVSRVLFNRSTSLPAEQVQTSILDWDKESSLSMLIQNSYACFLRTVSFLISLRLVIESVDDEFLITA
jgi:hypothetical protein